MTNARHAAARLPRPLRRNIRAALSYLVAMLVLIPSQTLTEDALGISTRGFARFWFAIGSDALLAVLVIGGWFAASAIADALDTGEPFARLALRIAGKRRGHLRDEWLGDLLGVPEEGIIVTPAQARRMAGGFVWAAVRLRLRDICRPAWRVIDWVLATEQRIHATRALLVAPSVIYFDIDGGISELFAQLPGIAVLGGALTLLARYLRKVRGITPEGADSSGPEE